MALSHGPNISTSNLILYLDASNSKSYPGTGGSWRNLISNANYTLNNSPTYTGGPSGYFNFNGTNQSVTATTLSGYGTTVTCESIFRTTSAATWKNLICGPTSDVIFTVNSNLLNFGTQGSSPIPHSNFSTTAVNTGAWFYGAATYDGSNVRIYVNGILESTTARTGTISPGALNIGSNSGSSSEYFVGDISFVRMYNRVLSTTEIYQNFQAARGRFGI